MKRKFRPHRPLTPQVGSSKAIPWIIWSIVVLVVLFNLSCRSGTAPKGQAELNLTIDAVPVLVLADSSSTSTIWATVTIDGEPVADSTVVFFASSLGGVESEAPTKDGLARAVFHAGRETGVAAVIAQVKAVRDTVLVTLY